MNAVHTLYAILADSSPTGNPVVSDQGLVDGVNAIQASMQRLKERISVLQIVQTNKRKVRS